MEKDKAKEMFMRYAPWIMTGTCLIACMVLVFTATAYQGQCNAYWAEQMIDCGCVDTIKPYDQEYIGIGAPPSLKITIEEGKD